MPYVHALSSLIYLASACLLRSIWVAAAIWVTAVDLGRDGHLGRICMTGPSARSASSAGLSTGRWMGQWYARGAK
jgi:hypothetical protein